MFLGLQNDREWVVLCERVLGRPDLISDERFRTNPDRVAHDGELTDIIETAIESHAARCGSDLLDRAGIASARLRTPAEYAAHPQLEARKRWRDVDTPPVRCAHCCRRSACRAARPRWGPSPRWASTQPPSWQNSSRAT